MDKQLGIRTTGRDDSNANDYNYPYEPTDYRVLQRLAQQGYINKKSHLVDYGCGKGRVSFYLSWQTGCKSIGVELDQRLYESACKNLRTYVKPYNVSFINENAVSYNVTSESDRFYFFNPFSVEVLSSVINQIKNSYYESEREIYMFFYYPSDEYVAKLMTDDIISFEDEIDCSDLFGNNDKRERILVFKLC